MKSLPSARIRRTPRRRSSAGATVPEPVLKSVSPVQANSTVASASRRGAVEHAHALRRPRLPARSGTSSGCPGSSRRPGAAPCCRCPASDHEPNHQPVFRGDGRGRPRARTAAAGRRGPEDGRGPRHLAGGDADARSALPPLAAAPGDDARRAPGGGPSGRDHDERRVTWVAPYPRRGRGRPASQRPALHEAVNRDSLLAAMPYRPTERTEARKAATRERDRRGRAGPGGRRRATPRPASRASPAAPAWRSAPSTDTSPPRAISSPRSSAEPRSASSTSWWTVSRADGRGAAERVAAAVEAFCRRALAGPCWPTRRSPSPSIRPSRRSGCACAVGYRDAFARVLEDGVTGGELRPHDTRTVAAALVGALAEASSVRCLRGERRPPGRPCVAALVQFSQEALPSAHARVHA